MADLELNEEEAAAYLGLTVEEMHQKRMRHDPPLFSREGLRKTVRYRRKDLDRYQADEITTRSALAWKAREKFKEIK